MYLIQVKNVKNASFLISKENGVFTYKITYRNRKREDVILFGEAKSIFFADYLKVREVGKQGDHPYYIKLNSPVMTLVKNEPFDMIYGHAHMNIAEEWHMELRK